MYFVLIIYFIFTVKVKYNMTSSWNMANHYKYPNAQTYCIIFNHCSMQLKLKVYLQTKNPIYLDVPFTTDTLYQRCDRDKMYDCNMGTRWCPLTCGIQLGSYTRVSFNVRRSAFCMTHNREPSVWQDTQSWHLLPRGTCTVSCPHGNNNSKLRKW